MHLVLTKLKKAKEDVCKGNNFCNLAKILLKFNKIWKESIIVYFVEPSNTSLMAWFFQFFEWFFYKTFFLINGCVKDLQAALETVTSVDWTNRIAAGCCSFRRFQA